MDSTLYIRSSYSGYLMWLRNSNKEIICFTSYAFTSHTSHLRQEELQKASLADTMRLIELAQNNGITSFVVEFRGPLATSPLNAQLLEAHGINIKCIKDKTPIPHNGCRPRSRERIRRF